MLSCGRFCLFVIVGLLVTSYCVFGNEADQTTGNDPTPDAAQVDKPLTLEGLDAEEMKTLLSTKHDFGVEVNNTMGIIIKSLYKTKDMFLRELVSNAADAVNKIKFLALTNPAELDSTEELVIRITADKDAKTLHIIDTGIGMTRDDLVQSLGTIAKSGTSKFVQELAKAQSDSERNDLIGQFGVGFYSAFLVADRVVVVSKHNSDVQYIWESDSSSFSYAKDPRGTTLKRGTEIILHLKDESVEFLDPANIEGVVKKYSQFINVPIMLYKSHVEKIEIDGKETESKSDEDVEVEEETKSEPKTEDKTIWVWERINSQEPVWTHKPSSEEFDSLYRNMSLDSKDPLGKIHFTATGDVEFTGVLFIPEKPPHNWMTDNEALKKRIKLLVKHVHIHDAGSELLPRYLAFVLGLIDSDELPLNVSRETIQLTESFNVIKKKIVRKVLEMIRKLSADDYEKFYKEYAINIKHGIYEDHSNKQRLVKLLRFYSTKSQDKLSSLDDYVSRMKKTQKKIYYITASSLEEAKLVPFVERLSKHNYEVIYMTDPIDHFILPMMPPYQEFEFQDAAKEGASIDDEETIKSLKEDFEDLSKWFADEALKGLVEKVEVSQVLVDTPCALLASKFGWTAGMQRVMQAQAYQRGDDTASNFYASSKKILSINPRHPIIKELKSLVKADPKDKEALETARVLFDLATLRSGYPLSKPDEFAQHLESIMRKHLQIDHDEPVDDEDVPEDEPKVSTEAPQESTSESKGETDEGVNQERDKDEL